MTKSSVNINKIATLRNARGGNVPDVLKAAVDCERFGAQGITVPEGSSLTNINAMQFKGYNYYFKLPSKDKKAVKEAYQSLRNELEILGFRLTAFQGDKGDKEPLRATHNTYHVECCYYLNVHDQYVIQLKVEPYQNN